MLQYRVPHAEQVEAWAARTLVLHDDPSLDLNHLREALGERKVPSLAGDQTWMHLVVESSDSYAVSSRVGFVFHTHHAVTDGNGTKIIINQYLTELALRLANPASLPGVLDLPWGDEVKELTPAIFNVLCPSEPIPIPLASDEEPTFSHPVYATLATEMQAIADSLKVR
ncbi:hypothetical protein R3P38DRAFT_3073750 [Favolaschia claudopus]|uniref:Condensation domain-containing protein n=1 Tax=Favolaschia claudopus TaxID=2862362 RepID=A0AAV9ZYJ4_9AGAR